MWTTKQAEMVAAAALSGTCSAVWVLWGKGTSGTWIMLAIAIGLTVAMTFWLIARWGTRIQESKEKVKTTPETTVKAAPLLLVPLNKWPIYCSQCNFGFRVETSSSTWSGYGSIITCPKCGNIQPCKGPFGI